MNEKVKQPDLEYQTQLRLMALELSVDYLNRRIEEIALKTQKLEIAYYQAFPDRAAEDLRFENQLHALISPLKPGATNTR
jgi:hypothetical protein